MIDVNHIAHLARIALTDQEKEKFQKELSAILGFVEKLNELNTNDIQPMAGGTRIENENELRNDERESLLLEEKSQALLDAAPEKKEGWVRVRKILG